MTEEQAKIYNCPFGYSGISNLKRDWDGNAKCIASECILWRWSSTTSVNGPLSKPQEGYCGLGGKL